MPDSSQHELTEAHELPGMPDEAELIDRTSRQLTVVALGMASYHPAER